MSGVELPKLSSAQAAALDSLLLCHNNRYGRKWGLRTNRTRPARGWVHRGTAESLERLELVEPEDERMPWMAKLTARGVEVAREIAQRKQVDRERNL